MTYSYRGLKESVQAEPTATELAAIEAEWPLIATALDVTDAECRLAASPGDVLAVRAYRRAVRRALAARTAATRTTTAPRPDVAPVSTPDAA